MKGWSKFWVSLKPFPLGLGWNWTDVYLTILYNIDQYWRILTSTPFAAWLVEWLPASERLHITGCQSWHKTPEHHKLLAVFGHTSLQLSVVTPLCSAHLFLSVRLRQQCQDAQPAQVLTVDSQVEFKLTQLISVPGYQIKPTTRWPPLEPLEKLCMRDEANGFQAKVWNPDQHTDFKKLENVFCICSSSCSCCIFSLHCRAHTLSHSPTEVTFLSVRPVVVGRSRNDQPPGENAFSGLNSWSLATNYMCLFSRVRCFALSNLIPQKISRRGPGVITSSPKDPKLSNFPMALKAAFTSCSCSTAVILFGDTMTFQPPPYVWCIKDSNAGPSCQGTNPWKRLLVSAWRSIPHSAAERCSAGHTSLSKGS